MTHDRTDKLQCPLCLKTTGLYGEKGYSADTAVKFMQHLQRHEDTKAKTGLNCRKCALKFVDEKSVKQHAEQDHNSYREFEDLETGEPETGVQMPPPEERGVKIHFTILALIQYNIIISIFLNYKNVSFHSTKYSIKSTR